MLPMWSFSTLLLLSRGGEVFFPLYVIRLYMCPTVAMHKNTLVKAKRTEPDKEEGETDNFSSTQTLLLSLTGEDREEEVGWKKMR